MGGHPADDAEDRSENECDCLQRLCTQSRMWNSASPAHTEVYSWDI